MVGPIPFNSIPYYFLLTALDRSATDDMSHHNHDMDEEMEEEGGQMSVAWLGMDLREQIKGKSSYRSYSSWRY